MPRADFTSDFRSDLNQSRFPRLKLQKSERARIVIAGSLQVEFLHRLNAPNIVNGGPTYKKIVGEDKSEKLVVETRWVSSPLCHGSYETLRERGVDEKGCHACYWARERPDIFRGPDMRFAGNILQYNLRPGGAWHDLANPYGVQSKIWVFSDKVFNKLNDLKNMGGQFADLRMVDLLIQCGDKSAEEKYQEPYSKGEFTPFAPAAWLANDAIRKYTVDYLAGQSATEEDLTNAIGRAVKAEYMDEDIDRVIKRWDVVRAYESRQGGAPVLGQGFGAESFAQGMAGVQQQWGPPQAGGGSSQPNGQNGGGGGNGYASTQGGAGGVGVQYAPAEGRSGLDMSLLGGGQAATPPPPPLGTSAPGPIAGMPAAASQRADALLAAAQPELDKLQEQQMQTLVAAGVPAVIAKPEWKPPAGPSTPPVGLSGLEEYMPGATHNPSSLPEGAPLTPPGPAAAEATAPQADQPKRVTTFAELAALAEKNK